MTLVLASALAFVSSDRLSAQQLRRSAPANEAPRASQPSNAPAAAVGAARFPFAGNWSGSMTMKNGPGLGDVIPIGMSLIVEDTARGKFAGTTLMPGGARVPHLGSAVTGRQMKWEQTNNGGGRWHYTARLVSRDSIAGTLTLVGWPDAGATPPNGTFSLVRRTANGRGLR
jgi:hypothetical protein